MDRKNEGCFEPHCNSGVLMTGVLFISSIYVQSYESAQCNFAEQGADASDMWKPYTGLRLCYIKVQRCLGVHS